MIKEIMNVAGEIVDAYKELLDVTVGDMPIGCVYAGDGIYVGVVTAEEPYKVCFYDFSVSSDPFLLIGANCYHPRMEGCSLPYFIPIAKEALEAFKRVLEVRKSNL